MEADLSLTISLDRGGVGASWTRGGRVDFSTHFRGRVNRLSRSNPHLLGFQ